MKQIIIVLCLTLCLNSYSQSEFEIGLYNVGLGGFGGAIGAVINKKPNEKIFNVFCSGFLKGSLGGTFVYGSKKMVSQIHIKEKIEYNWLAKILNSLGTSMIENASSNRKLFEQLHINIGFNRIEVHTKNKIKYKIMPVALLITGIYAYGNKFELEKSLKTGEILFSVSKNFKHAGATWGKLILIDESWLDKNNLIAHEIIHSYQYEDFNFVNTFINKPKLELLNKSKLGEKLNNFFYFDLQAPIFGGCIY